MNRDAAHILVGAVILSFAQLFFFLTGDALEYVQDAIIVEV